MRLDTSVFSRQKDIHEYLHRHAAKVIYSKKSDRKNSDTYKHVPGIIAPEGSGLKGINNTPLDEAPDILEVKVAVNTTNLYDSHQDVHISGLWKKTLKENKYIQHLREHKSGFANVISDGADLKAYTEKISFKDLGFKYEGETEALMFDSNINKRRNEFMHEQYASGWVKEHSVGMHYVNVLVAIDSKDYPSEYKTWKKYIDKIGNKDDIKEGFFFAVTEAKLIEGSAVTRGSNHVTPTINNNKGPAAGHPTAKEPPPSTRKNNLTYLL